MGDKNEDAFRQAMLSADGSASIFWSDSLVTVMMLIGCVLLPLPFISMAFRRVSTGPKLGAGAAQST